MSVSRGNTEDIALSCFNEDNIIESLCLEEELSDSVQDFIELRVSDTCRVFRVIMTFCFYLHSIKICRWDDGTIVANGM